MSPASLRDRIESTHEQHVARWKVEVTVDEFQCRSVRLAQVGSAGEGG